MRRTLVALAILGGSALAIWGLASLDPQPVAKFVDVRIDADEDVCWEIDNGRVSAQGLREEMFGCGPGGTDWDDDLVAVPSSVIVRKVQGEGALRAWFAVNDEITDSATMEAVGDSTVLSGD